MRHTCVFFLTILYGSVLSLLPFRDVFFNWPVAFLSYESRKDWPDTATYWDSHNKALNNMSWGQVTRWIHVLLKSWCLRLVEEALLAELWPADCQLVLTGFSDRLCLYWCPGTALSPFIQTESSCDVLCIPIKIFTIFLLVYQNTKYRNGKMRIMGKRERRKERKREKKKESWLFLAQ